MEEEDLRPATHRTLRFREIYADGRVITIIASEDGEWKIEIFASVDHATKFAREHGIQILN